MLSERLIFSPPDPAAVLDDFRDPALSLRDLAARYHTTAEALALWCSRPEIQERIAITDNAAAIRTRSIAGDCLPTAVHTLSLILQAFNAGQLSPPRDEPAPEAQPSPSPQPNSATSAHTPQSQATSRSSRSSIPPHVHRHRACETARHAATDLTRLARFAPGPARQRVALASGSGLAGAITPTVANSPPLSAPPAHATFVAAQRHPSISPGANTPTEAELLRRAEAFAGSLDTPELADEELDAFLRALDTGITDGLPPPVAECVKHLRGQGHPPITHEILTPAGASGDTS